MNEFFKLPLSLKERLSVGELLMIRGGVAYSASNAGTSCTAKNAGKSCDTRNAGNYCNATNISGGQCDATNLGNGDCSCTNMGGTTQPQPQPVNSYDGTCK